MAWRKPLVPRGYQENQARHDASKSTWGFGNGRKTIRTGPEVPHSSISKKVDISRNRRKKDETDDRQERLRVLQRQKNNGDITEEQFLNETRILFNK